MSTGGAWQRISAVSRAWSAEFTGARREWARRFGSDNRTRTWAEFLVSLLSTRFVPSHETTPVGTAKSAGISLLGEGNFLADIAGKFGWRDLWRDLCTWTCVRVQ